MCEDRFTEVADEQDLSSLRSRSANAAAGGLGEWLPEDHLACVISDIVDQLDLSAITACYEQGRRGGPLSNPRMIVKVLLYGERIGVASLRRIARRCPMTLLFGCGPESTRAALIDRKGTWPVCHGSPWA